ncbi:MAG: 50S ribosomal protein L25 [Bacteroidetes bacterium]|nr:50S ribosomal protein L25 [Bacteroidota bacterium]
MKTFALSAETRETNKIASRALRNQGKVPCVVYGGEKQVYFSASENDLNKLVNTPDVFLVTFEVEGEKFQAILQDIQFHPVTDKIIHVDFLQAFDDKEVTVNIPVRFEGTPVGVRNGGNLSVRRRSIITRALPGNLPDAITLNIEDIKIGKFIYIGDIRDEKYTFLAPDNSVIVGVKMARGAVDDEEEGEEGEEGAEGEAAEGAEAPAAE